MTQLDLQQRIEELEGQVETLSFLNEQRKVLMVERDALQQQVNAQAAENLALKNEKPDFISIQNALITFYSDDEVPESQMLMAFNILRNGIKASKTEDIKHQLMVEGVNLFAREQKLLADANIGESHIFSRNAQCRAEVFAAKLRQPEEKGNEIG